MIFSDNSRIWWELTLRAVPEGSISRANARYEIIHSLQLFYTDFV